MEDLSPGMTEAAKTGEEGQLDVASFRKRVAPHRQSTTPW